MLPENNEKPKTVEYPVNLFEESHDHSNQWDVTELWPEPEAESHDEKHARASGVE